MSRDYRAVPDESREEPNRCFRVTDKPTLCPVCWDSQLQPEPNMILTAAQRPEDTRNLDATVYRCSNWHFFAVLTRDGTRVDNSSKWV